MLWFICCERNAGLCPFFRGAFTLELCLSVPSRVAGCKWKRRGDEDDVRPNPRTHPTSHRSTGTLGMTSTHHQQEHSLQILKSRSRPVTAKTRLTVPPAEKDTKNAKVQPSKMYTMELHEVNWIAISRQMSRMTVLERSTNPRPNSLKRGLPNPYRLIETSRNYKLLRSHVLRKTNFKDQQDDTLSVISCAQFSNYDSAMLKTWWVPWALLSRTAASSWWDLWASQRRPLSEIVLERPVHLKCTFLQKHYRKIHLDYVMSLNLRIRKTAQRIRSSDDVRFSNTHPTLLFVGQPCTRSSPSRCVSWYSTTNWFHSRSSRSVNGNNRCRPDFPWSSK